MTMLYCGKVLACPSQRLVDAVGSPPAGGLTVHCLKKGHAPTQPTPVTTLTPQAAAAAAAAARFAAAEKDAAAAVPAAAATGVVADEPPLKVRPAHGSIIKIPLTPGMTAKDLKAELQQRGEGPAEQFRLLCSGKEVSHFPFMPPSHCWPC